jgi:parvulin-like peptidyl-prolyl isomerase
MIEAMAIVMALWADQNAPTAPAAADVGIAAICDKDSITWQELQPVLAERAGAAALEEVLLDKRVRAAAQDRGIVVTDEMMKREEDSLRAQLAPDGARAEQLLDEVRARQGLGPRRWQALLWRNAALRAMVARDVEVRPEQVTAQVDAVYGPKRRARVIAVPDMRAAQKAIERLKAGEAFGDVAAEVSTDASASRGGLIAPVSRLDPAFPASFREALWSIAGVGEVSSPVLGSSGLVLVRFEGEEPAAAQPPADARAAAERAVRFAQERARMEELARDLVRGAKPTIFDDGLADSWQRSGR